PALHWTAAVSALLAAAAVLLRERTSLRAWFAGAFALSFLALLANGRLLGSYDTRPTALVPLALLREGTLTLPRAPLVGSGQEPPYWAVPRGDRLASRYPLATALLAVPVYLPAALGQVPLTAPAVDELEKLAAALWTAAGVGLIAAALRRLTSAPVAAAA